jgi:hypothetical protein
LDGLVVHGRDPAVDAARRHDLAAGLERRPKRRLLLAPSPLRAQDEEPEEQSEGDERQELHLRIRDGRAEPLERLRRVLAESAALDRRPCAGSQFGQEAKIMKAKESQPQDLLLVDQMADVAS